MDTYCDKSLYLKNHTSGLDLRLTESDVYKSDVNCTVRLVARTHHRVVIAFIDLDISSFVSCPEDYLQIGECVQDRPCEGVCCVFSSLYCCQLPYRGKSRLHVKRSKEQGLLSRNNLRSKVT